MPDFGGQQGWVCGLGDSPEGFGREGFLDANLRSWRVLDCVRLKIEDWCLIHGERIEYMRVLDAGMSLMMLRSMFSMFSTI